MIKWFKQNLAMLMLSLSKVENNAIYNTGNSLGSLDGTHNRLMQGRLSDSLINGEITEEVKELRWRMYKIMKESTNLKTDIVDYDSDGLPITKTFKVNRHKLDKVVVDEYDDFKPILVVNNDEITLSSKDVLDMGEFTNLEEKEYKPHDVDMVDNKANTLGVLSNDHYESSVKSYKPIKVIRDTIDVFNIETYTKKMVVRDMLDGNYLLEFYISKYPNYENRKTIFLTNFLKEALLGVKLTFFHIKKVSFLSDKTIGCDDNLYFEYDIIDYDKTVLFNGFYVIKFKAKAITNGLDVTNVYINEALDEKYKNKTEK
jgi:hypothetical protein